MESETKFCEAENVKSDLEGVDMATLKEENVTIESKESQSRTAVKHNVAC